VLACRLSFAVGVGGLFDVRILAEGIRVCWALCRRLGVRLALALRILEGE
jgi:hypothetical protein